MAKKRAGSKETPSFVVVQPQEKGRPKPKKSSKNETIKSLVERPEVTLEFLMELFLGLDFKIQRLSDDSFIAIDPEMQALTVQINDEFQLICLGGPLEFKSGILKSRKLAWINSEMLNYPFIRICLEDDGTATMSFEYLYVHTFDELTFIGMMSMVLNIMYQIYSSGEETVLKNIPRFTPEDFE